MSRQLVTALMLLLLVACAPPAPPTLPNPALRVPGPAGWPARTAALEDLDLAVPGDFGTRKIFVDAGHGTADNTGTKTAWCEDEGDVMLDVAQDLARRLEATGVFEVRVSREGADGPSYARRVDDAAGWGADAFVSLHLDARGDTWGWQPAPGLTCWRNEDIPGFAVLVSDRGDEPLVEDRLRLARAVSGRMGQAGFLPYGWGYAENYDYDPTPGVYLDRRVLFVLRKPTMPSILVETHNGLGLDERARWSEERTRRAFAAALAQAFVDSL